MAIQINGVVQTRADTAANFSSNNPILNDRELAFETDTLKMKAGDGVTAWNSLKYMSGGSGGGAVPPNALSAQSQVGIMLPLYIYPSDIYNDTTVWGKMFSVKRANKDIPMIVIVNPNDGAGSVVDGNWTGAIRKSIGAGVIPVGYIYSSYGLRPIAEAKADIDKWLELYPDIQGIFVDEMWYANDERVDWYREVVEYANDAGLYITIGNPGDQSDNVYMDFFSIVVCWETDAAGPTQEQMENNWPGGATDKSIYQRAFLKIGAATYDTTFHSEVIKWYGWIYTTDDTMDPNPWDSISSYMDDMVNTIHGV